MQKYVRCVLVSVLLIFFLLGIMLRPREFRELVVEPRRPVGDHGDLLSVLIGAGVDDEFLSVRRNIVGNTLVGEGLHFALEQLTFGSLLTGSAAKR